MERVEFLRNFVVFTEFLSFIIGLFFLRKLTSIHWKLFPFYLGVIFSIEVLAWYFIQKKLFDYNVYLYRFIAQPIQFFFIFWLYYKILKLKQKQLMLILFSTIYTVSWLLEYYIIPRERHASLSISFSVGSLLLLILILIYFYKLIYSAKILNFYHDRAFWVSSGILIYYLGSFPFYGLFNLLIQKYQTLHFLYFQVVLVLSSSMYLLFSASFIWGKEK